MRGLGARSIQVCSVPMVHFEKTQILEPKEDGIKNFQLSAEIKAYSFEEPDINMWNCQQVGKVSKLFGFVEGFFSV